MGDFRDARRARSCLSRARVPFPTGQSERKTERAPGPSWGHSSSYSVLPKASLFRESPPLLQIYLSIYNMPDVIYHGGI